jgi:hypothetical protein
VTDGWSDADPEPEPAPPQRSRPRLLAGVAGALVVLAAVGATGGWLLARSNGDASRSGRAGASPSYGPSVSPSPSYTDSSPSPTAVETFAEQFVLPDLTGRDVTDARRSLLDRRLGVVVIFGGRGDDRSVERTDPPPGTDVHIGMTVKLYVPGEPPVLTVPRLLGMTCPAAGRAAADRGFTPRYVPDRAGVVVRQEPEPSAEARWNDRITLHCATGTATSTPY